MRLIVLAALSGLTGPIAAQAQGSARTTELEAQLLLRPAEASLYIALAAERERLGDRVRAEAALRAGVAAADDARAVRAALAEFLARGEHWREAVAVAESLGQDSRTRGFRARLRVNAGVAAYRAGDRGVARRHWERALEDDPALAQAAVDLGALLLELHETDAARAVASRALVHHPDHEQLRALRAATLGGAEGVAAAVTELRRRRAARPKDERLGLELAGVLAGSDRAAAGALYDSLLAAPAPGEETYLAAARFWLDGNQAGPAAQVSERGLERFERSGALQLLLGEARAAGRDWRAAVTAYRRAATRLSAPEEAELPLIDVLIQAGDTAEALNVIGHMARRPASRDALLRAGTTATGLRAPARADSIYRDLLVRNPDDVAALEAGAELAEAAGDTARALGLYVRAAEQDSSGPIAPLGLLRLRPHGADGAQLLLRRAAWRGMDELQRLELATTAAVSGPLNLRVVAASQPALERRKRIADLLRATLDTIVLARPWGVAELQQLRLAYPGSALIERYVGAIAERDGSDSVALAVYDAVLRREAADPVTQRARAAVLLRLGRRAEAIAAYVRAFDLDPEHTSTFQSLRELRQRDGSLAALLEQVQRLRVRLPRSRIVAEQEIEVLQRMGRLAEAVNAAAKLREKP
jgi:tetratricopeptide (TPR) repeat protein